MHGTEARRDQAAKIGEGGTQRITVLAARAGILVGDVDKTWKAVGEQVGLELLRITPASLVVGRAVQIEIKELRALDRGAALVCHICRRPWGPGYGISLAGTRRIHDHRLQTRHDAGHLAGWQSVV